MSGKGNNSTTEHICPSCGVHLVEPYIRCMECKDPSRSFCLQCFAKGAEYGNHVNTHAYAVVNLNFSIFDPAWMAGEEVKLLDAVELCGVGNWGAISKLVGTKTKKQCEKHYYRCYIDNPKPPLPENPAPVLEEKDKIFPTPIPCTSSNDPPRAVIGSIVYGEMGGYMPARGDFATEYDEYAEMDMKDIDFVEEKDPLLIELQMAVINIYRLRLRERQRRKHIMKKYALISFQKNMEEWRRYDILGKHVIEKLKPLMRLMKPRKFDEFIEGVLCEEKLKRRIKLLQECRAAGVRKLKSVATYAKLKQKRDLQLKSKTLLDNVLTHVKDDASRKMFIRKQVMKENSEGLSAAAGSSAMAGRRSAPPLIIAGLPGYSELSEKERELCAILRLYPTSYLQYKATLVHEYAKLGTLRLANARSVIKIDVNKTRKIYDLLLEEGVIKA